MTRKENMLFGAIVLVLLYATAIIMFTVCYAEDEEVYEPPAKEWYLP